MRKLILFVLLSVTAGLSACAPQQAQSPAPAPTQFQCTESNIGFGALRGPDFKSCTTWSGQVAPQRTEVAKAANGVLVDMYAWTTIQLIHQGQPLALKVTATHIWLYNNMLDERVEHGNIVYSAFEYGDLLKAADANMENTQYVTVFATNPDDVFTSVTSP